MRSRLSRLLIATCFMFAVFGSCAEAAAEAVPSPEEMLQYVIDSQHALSDFTARGKMELYIGRSRFPVSMKIYAKRPNSTAVKAMGVTVKSKGGGVLLPSPSVFLKSGDYELSSGGTRAVFGTRRYIVLATPRRKDPELYSWRLEIAPDPWVIVVSEAHDDKGESTRLEAEYQRVTDGCWLPIRFHGRGKLLLRSALPDGFLTWVFNLFTGKEEVQYWLNLSELEINVGLPDSMFK